MDWSARSAATYMNLNISMFSDLRIQTEMLSIYLHSHIQYSKTEKGHDFFIFYFYTYLISQLNRLQNWGKKILVSRYPDGWSETAWITQPWREWSKKEKYPVSTSFPSENLIDEVEARAALSQNEAFQITTDYYQGMEKSMSKCSTC